MTHIISLNNEKIIKVQVKFKKKSIEGKVLEKKGNYYLEITENI